MDTPDPITPLTPVEAIFTAVLDATKTREWVLSQLKANLQTAVQIELATIPIYLFTYYSLNRNATSGEQMSDVQIFANKAGGVIMSVAVEEMLHMSLSSNILFSLGVAPQLYANAPGSYPTPLPYHRVKGPKGPKGDRTRKVEIPLAPFSFDQLWHFLQIEYPEQWDALPEDRNWQTIGQFYSYIRCLIRTKFVTDADFQKGPYAHGIQPFNYSPNNVDTVYPLKDFDPWKPAPPAPKPKWADKFPSAAQVAQYPDYADSHAGKSQLLCIQTRQDAAEAIDTICDQGEGCPVPDVGPSPDDDPSKDEDSHYVKFLKLQAQLKEYAGCREQLPPEPKPPAPVKPTMSHKELEKAGLLYNFPANPKNAHYPDEYRAIAEFTSALFQYMLVMTETIYLVPPEKQKLFFNEGLHRSMIWVLDKYIKTIRQIPIPTGAYKGTVMAPTFENVPLGPRVDSFAGLKRYGDAAIDAANKLSNGPIGTDLASALANVVYYIGVALTKTDGAAPMHLPDVGPYWAAVADAQ